MDCHQQGEGDAMTLSEIKAAVDLGKKVRWSNSLYSVVKDDLNRYLVVCSSNNYAFGLTHKDGVTLCESESTFYIEGSKHA